MLQLDISKHPSQKAPCHAPDIGNVRGSRTYGDVRSERNCPHPPPPHPSPKHSPKTPRRNTHRGPPTVLSILNPKPLNPETLNPKPSLLASRHVHPSRRLCGCGDGVGHSSGAACAWCSKSGSPSEHLKVRFKGLFQGFIRILLGFSVYSSFRKGCPKNQMLGTWHHDFPRV